MKSRKKVLGVVLGLTLMICSTAYAGTGSAKMESRKSVTYSTQFEDMAKDPRYVGLSGCTLAIGENNNGLGVSYTSGFTKVADEVGVKNVKLQVKSGLTWKTVHTVSKAYNSNSASFAGGFSYLSGANGSEYRVQINYYAVYGGQTYSLSDTSDIYVY